MLSIKYTGLLLRESTRLLMQSSQPVYTRGLCEDVLREVFASQTFHRGASDSRTQTCLKVEIRGESEFDFLS